MGKKRYVLLGEKSKNKIIENSENMMMVGYGITHLKSGAILRDKVRFTFSMRKAMGLCNPQKYVRRRQF